MDLIDMRNQKEKMAKSVIKRRNVVYAPPAPKQEPEPEEVVTGQETATETDEILKRVQQKKQEDEEKKRKELEDLIAHQDTVQQEINRILTEKQEDVQKTIQSITDGGNLDMSV